MPIGRFRKDPRELDEVEQAVSAKQFPEAALMIGMGLGLTIPMLLLPDAGVVAALCSILGGIVGYLVGHRFKRRRIEKRRAQTREP